MTKEEITLNDVVIITVNYLEQQKKSHVIKETQYELLNERFWDFKDLIDKTIEGNFR